MNYNFLSKTALFRGTKETEVKDMLSCLSCYSKIYDKNQTIYQAGENVESLGLVLYGGVNIELDDLWGNKSIFSHVEAGQIFAETYACLPGERLMVNVVASEKSEILFLNTKKIMQTCPNSCAYHHNLIYNLLQISAEKNLELSSRIIHTSSKSIRDRLLSYFSQQALQNGSYNFTIPFNRQQLADYLNVERSAMSNELSKMQKDGLLSYEKNSFKLKQIL